MISAGEASGDLYAATLVGHLKQLVPQARFFGCAGPRMQAVGVEPVVDAAKLSVVGLVEVVRHIPEIYGEYRKLIREARRRRPALAIVTDSPDFHLRVAAQLKRRGIPVVYLVAPQVWAWRKGRLNAMRRNIDELLCIFPFEEQFFRNHNVPVHYIGHPLKRLVKPANTREEFFARHSLPRDRPLVTILPGSRRGEIGRHLPVLARTLLLIQSRAPSSYVLGAPPEAVSRFGEPFFTQPFRAASIQQNREILSGPGAETVPLVVEGETWDAIAHADLVLAASGTVTMEAALLGTPMVTFYRVTGVSWWMGRFLVDVPFFTMVNLIAQERVVPELIQNEMTAENLAREAVRLLENPAEARRMRDGLGKVSDSLDVGEDPLVRAAGLIARRLTANSGS
ncbi:MAG TPA: lipid-A-disaccharide synthase [Bryobacteraceae bacterium]|nr:lipid-A-disaccharide synthase [Bryobacteraceae bacterium]